MESTVNVLEAPQSCLAYAAAPISAPSPNESRPGWAVLHALLEQLPVGVVVANAEGPVRVVYENELAQRIRMSDSAKAEWPMARALLLGEVVRDEEINVAMTDGTRRWLSVSATPIRMEGDLIEGAVVTFVDVTASKQAAAWQPVIESLQRL
jgi:PAS domain-containing protein